MHEREEKTEANARVSISMCFSTDRQQIQLAVPQTLLRRPEGGDPHEG